MADKDSSAPVPSPSSKRTNGRVQTHPDRMQHILNPDSLLGNPNPPSNNPIAQNQNAEHQEAEDQETEHQEAEDQVAVEESVPEDKLPIIKRKSKRPTHPKVTLLQPFEDPEDLIRNQGLIRRTTRSMSRGLICDNADYGGGGRDGGPLLRSQTRSFSHNAEAARIAKERVVTGNLRIWNSSVKKSADKREEGSSSGKKRKPVNQGDWRVCVECGSDQGTMTSPTWRSGPEGPGTLCNACGLRHANRRKDAKE